MEIIMSQRMVMSSVKLFPFLSTMVPSSFFPSLIKKERMEVKRAKQY